MKIRKINIPITWGLAVLSMMSVNALAQTKTAQSAMFINEASGNFVITGSEVWSYNRTTAATYYTNLWDGNAPPPPTCTGPGCDVCPVPAAPGAPDPTDTKLNPVLGQNSCTFFDGGR